MIESIKAGPDAGPDVGLQIIPVIGLPEVSARIRLAELINEHWNFHDGDVLVVSSKIVSKAEGRIVSVARDDTIARRKLIEAESVRILRVRGELFITETRHGFICANAGIDWSNVMPGHALLLPEDPDRSARKIRDGLRALAGVETAVIISDTFGRTWRKGVSDIAIGCAGIRPILDLRGEHDVHGNQLQVTQVCVADQLAAAAELVMGKLSQIPVAIVRGVANSWFGSGSIRNDVVRHPNEDLFR